MDPSVSGAEPAAHRVALFVTCLNDTLFPEVGRAAVTLLRRAGCAVDFPLEQTCCGQLHYNAGYRREALRLARRFVEQFRDAEAVVVPSASCAAHLREHACRLEAGRLLRVFELAQFLAGELGWTATGARSEARIAYHPSCHSLRSLRLGDEPRRLLASVEGATLVRHDNAEECCGFGGTFAVKNAATSAAILEEKIEALEASGAEVVCALDSSCLMHIGGGLVRKGSPIRALHLAQLLAGDGDR